MSAIESVLPGERAPIRVAVVEDHALLAHALTQALREIGVFAESVVPSSDAEIFGGVAGIQPDVVLLDLDLGALGSSVRLIPDVRALGCKVVVVTGEESRARWGECIEAGADAVVSKALSFDDLLGRITNILDESKGVSSEQDELRACAREHRREEKTRLVRFEALTPRECDVLDALTQGRSAEEIAAGAFVSLATVRTHIRSILQKLGVSSQLAAVATANRCGWRNRQD